MIKLYIGIYNTKKKTAIPFRAAHPVYNVDVYTPFIKRCNAAVMDIMPVVWRRVKYTGG